MSQQAPWFSATVYGRSGSGKTTLGVTAPKPLILLSERQAVLPISLAAQRLGIPVPPTLALDDLNDCRNIARALRGPKDQPFRVFEFVYDADGNAERDAAGQAKRELVFELPVDQWPETVVLDSVTDICRLVEEEIRRQSPPRQGKDGLPVDSERFWNVLGDRCKNLIYGFRDAPVHKLFLCAEDDRDVGEGDDKRRSLGPALPMRKLPALLSGAGNMTGYAYRREVREGDKVRVQHGVMTTGPEFMLLKPCPPLRNTEVPDFGYWVRSIHGKLQGPQPAAPAPSGESMARPVSEADSPLEAARQAADTALGELAASTVDKLKPKARASRKPRGSK